MASVIFLIFFLLGLLGIYAIIVGKVQLIRYIGLKRTGARVFGASLIVLVFFFPMDYIMLKIKAMGLGEVSGMILGVVILFMVIIGWGSMIASIYGNATEPD